MCTRRFACLYSIAAASTRGRHGDGLHVVEPLQWERCARAAVSTSSSLMWSPLRFSQCETALCALVAPALEVLWASGQAPCKCPAVSAIAVGGDVQKVRE